MISSHHSAAKFLARVFVLGLVAVFAQVAGAYSPATPYRHVVSNGKFFFVMMTTEFEEKDGDWVESTGPRGAAYKVMRDGGFKKLWSVEGWYAFPEDVLLSADGKTLVGVREQFIQADGKIFGDAESSALLTFYRGGKVVAEYATKDLIADLKVGIRFDGFSGFRWIDRGELVAHIGRQDLHEVLEEAEGRATAVYHPDVSARDD